MKHNHVILNGHTQTPIYCIAGDTRVHTMDVRQISTCYIAERLEESELRSSKLVHRSTAGVFTISMIDQCNGRLGCVCTTLLRLDL